MVLNFGAISRFYFPLFLSALLMNLELPIVNAGIARLPRADQGLAAFGVAFTLVVLVESPIIPLLQTSTALCQHRQAFLTIWRYAVATGVGLTLLLALVAYTPLHELVLRRWMGLPPGVADSALVAMRIMPLWPLTIAWRRVFQGAMIRRGYTQRVGLGTGGRVAILASVVLLGTAFGPVDSVAMAALAMMASVTGEAIIATLLARPALRRILAEPLPARLGGPAASALTYGRLWQFHFPLAATSLIVYFSRPVVTTSIAYSPDATLSLAAWPVALSLVIPLMGSLLMLQQVVIALVGDAASEMAVRRFGVMMGLALGGLVLLMTTPPIAELMLVGVLGVSGEVKGLAVRSMQIMALLPVLTAWQNLYQGELVLRQDTKSIRLAAAANLVVLVAALAVGVGHGRVQGAPLAAGAMALALAAEVVVLRHKVLNCPTPWPSARRPESAE